MGKAKRDPREVIEEFMGELATKLEKETGTKVEFEKLGGDNNSVAFGFKGEITEESDEMDKNELDNRSKVLLNTLASDGVFDKNGDIDAVFIAGNYKSGGHFSATIGSGQDVFNSLVCYLSNDKSTLNMVKGAVEAAEFKSKLENSKDPEEMIDLVTSTLAEKLSKFLGKKS